MGRFPAADSAARRVGVRGDGVPVGRMLLLAVVALYVLATVVRIYVRRYDIFLADYMRRAVTVAAAPIDRPTHVFFLFVDHFEPDWSVTRTGAVGGAVPRAGGETSRQRRSAAATHLVLSRRAVDPAILTILQQMMRAGLGEVELHYHHDGDTAETLRPQWEEAIAAFQQFGFLQTVTGKTAFAFVHGNESLDNADGEYCGVNNELRLLHDLGCFADFTFPSVYHQAQPPFVNNIYAARDDDRPKSYDRQWPLLDLKRGQADLMIFQGPLVIAPTWNLRRLFLEVDDGNIHPAIPVDARACPSLGQRQRPRGGTPRLGLRESIRAQREHAGGRERSARWAFRRRPHQIGSGITTTDDTTSCTM